MKLLLTSAGIYNASIRTALVDLLGKAIAESSALCIPPAIYAFPGGAAMAAQRSAEWPRAPCAKWGSVSTNVRLLRPTK